MLFLFVATSIISSYQVGAHMLLQGSLGEYQGYPVNVHCEHHLGYIRLGGITVNDIPLTEKQQKKAEDECEKQMKKVEEQRLNPKKSNSTAGTMIYLTFPGMKIKDTDVIRIVYRCSNTKPSGSPAWGKDDRKGTNKDKYKTATAKDTKPCSLNCNSNEDMIFVNEAKIDGTVSSHPDLDPVTLSRKCAEQWKKIMEGLGKKYGAQCTIFNYGYGGELTIKYQCLSKDSERKEANGSKGKKEKEK